MNQPTSLFLLLLLTFSSHLVAKTSDNDAPIHIEADQLEMRQQEGISIYHGNVEISKGSLKINGDKIIVTHKNGSLYRITIAGKPATFYQLTDLNEAISAEGYHIEYVASTGMLELKQKALLLKNKNEFSSEHIFYDTLKDIVKAGQESKASTGKVPRVKITIYPEKNQP